MRKIDFPTLIKNSASIFDATTISLSLSAKYICVWIGTFPLWFFIPGGNILVPYLLLSWFNSQLLSYEVLLELMPKEGASCFIKNHRLDIYLMGLMTSVLYFIPLLNFLAPVITAFAFTRLILSKGSALSHLSPFLFRLKIKRNPCLS